MINPILARSGVSPRKVTENRRLFFQPDRVIYFPKGVVVDKNSTDINNTENQKLLRPGLLMAKKTDTKKWLNCVVSVGAVALTVGPTGNIRLQPAHYNYAKSRLLSNGVVIASFNAITKVWTKATSTPSAGDFNDATQTVNNVNVPTGTTVTNVLVLFNDVDLSLLIPIAENQGVLVGDDDVDWVSVPIEATIITTQLLPENSVIGVVPNLLGEFMTSQNQNRVRFTLTHDLV